MEAKKEATKGIDANLHQRQVSRSGVGLLH